MSETKTTLRQKLMKVEPRDIMIGGTLVIATIALGISLGNHSNTRQLAGAVGYINDAVTVLVEKM